MGKTDRISFIALAVFSFLILTLSGQLGTPLIRALILAGITATTLFVFFKREKAERNLSFIDWALLLYGFWIVISGAIHLVALYKLPRFSLVNVLYETREWALVNTVTHAVVYLLFPLFFLSARILFRSQKDVSKLFFWLPLLFLPSLFVAGYQSHFDIAALNEHGFARIGQASGLAVDSNTMGMLVFLIFPLSILAAFSAGKRFLKIAAVLCMVVVAGTFTSIGSRTEFAGIVFLFIASPLIVLLSSRKLGPRKRLLLTVSPLIFLIGVLLVATAYIRVGGQNESILTTRLSKTMQSFEVGGVSKVLDDRLLYWKPAMELSLESPVSGWGPGGFYRELPDERVREGDKKTQRDNATSQYLQMSSDFGVLGLIFNSLLHLLPIVMGLAVLRRIEKQSERWTVAAIVVVSSIMMVLFVTGPHTMPVDVQWVMCLLLAFLTVEAERRGISLHIADRKVLVAVSVGVTVLFAAGSWNNAFGSNGYKGRYLAKWWPFEAGEIGGQPDLSWGETRWEEYRKKIGGARIVTFFDEARKNLAVKFEGTGMENGYRLKNTDGLNKWNNRRQFFLKWSMRYSEPFMISVRIDTSAGIRYLQYLGNRRHHGGKGRYIPYGLGPASHDSQWHTYIRDLRKDLNEAQPRANLISVDSFMIRGNGDIDDIMLCSTPECRNPTVYENGENWGIDNDVKVCGLVTQRNFRIAEAWKIKDYENGKVGKYDTKTENERLKDGTIEDTENGKRENTKSGKYESGKWEIALSMLADDPDILDKLVTVKIYHGERLLDTLKLTSASWKKWTYPLTPDLITKLKKLGKDVVRLKFVVSRTFKDKKGRDIGLYVRRSR